MKSIISKLTLTAAALATPRRFQHDRRRRRESCARRRHSGRDARLHRRHRVLGESGQGSRSREPGPQGHYVKTAANAAEQANQLQDPDGREQINALVVFPFESAALTKPVAEVHNKGVYVTVVDRGLTDTSADAYVSGDNTAFGKIPAEYLASWAARATSSRYAGSLRRSTTKRWDVHRAS